MRRAACHPTSLRPEPACLIGPYLDAANLAERFLPIASLEFGRDNPRRPCAHDQADRNARDHAVSLGASGRGALRSPPIEPPMLWRRWQLRPVVFRRIVRFQLQCETGDRTGPRGKGTKNRCRTRRHDSSETGDRRRVRRDPVLGWRPTVVTAPKHTRNAQELADKIAAELRKKFTLKE